MKINVAIAGSGFAGAVLARELAESERFTVHVFDERSHTAGNCHTTRDEHSGVMVHHYGPHIFNTSREDVWRYVQRWGEFKPYTNRVKAVTAKGMFSLPINLLTINQFFGKNFSPTEAQEFVQALGDKTIVEPKNLEKQALKFLGRALYENFFYGYTKKQWGVEPRELPASILQRLPVRFNYDDNYYNQTYQGLPVEGYSKLIERMLDHPNIRVTLSTRLTAAARSDFRHVFYSGPLDAWFDFSLGRLQYRSLKFERIDAHGDFQGNAVINYCQQEVPHTRIAEHKHFAPWENHSETVCFKEFSKLAEPGDIPYYPLRLADDKALLQKYVEQAELEPNVTFLGRLATYRYLDMHVVIGESLDLAKKILSSESSSWPAFSVRPV